MLVRTAICSHFPKTTSWEYSGDYKLSSSTYWELIFRIKSEAIICPLHYPLRNDLKSLELNVHTGARFQPRIDKATELAKTNYRTFIVYLAFSIPEVFAFLMCILYVKDVHINWQTKPVSFPANLISFANNFLHIYIPSHYYFYPFVN